MIETGDIFQSGSIKKIRTLVTYKDDRIVENVSEPLGMYRLKSRLMHLPYTTGDDILHSIADAVGIEREYLKAFINKHVGMLDEDEVEP